NDNHTLMAHDEKEGHNFAKSKSIIRMAFEILIGHSISLYPVSRIIILVLCLEFYCIGKRFEKLIEKEWLVAKVIEKFDQLQKITAKSRKWAGGLLLENYVEVLVFLATTPQIIRTEIGVSDNHTTRVDKDNTSYS